MHVRRLEIENVRLIREFDLDLREDENPAGWHVLLGDNGSGKSTVVRALALALMGEANALATRQDWSRWLAVGSAAGSIRLQLHAHEDHDRWSGQGKTAIGRAIEPSVEIEAASGGNRAAIEFYKDNTTNRTVWGQGNGWFSASFGAFRRFSGSNPEMDRLYLTHPRLAAHLSAFGEDVALGESLRWLRNLQVKNLEGDGEAEKIKNAVVSFVNGSGPVLLPHGARIDEVTSDRVTVADGRGVRVDVEDMSDGYRSILSLIFELLRILFATSDAETVLSRIDQGKATVALPGVVAIDEIDAHLHPGWQQRIGDWFVDHFPETQFFVTTHSPIICRAARRGSVWQLPAPSSEEDPRRVVGTELARLIGGDILDAYGTELFGEDVTRSEQSKENRARLARLNRKRLRAPLSDDERRERDRLRAALPSDPGVTASSGG